MAAHYARCAFRVRMARVAMLQVCSLLRNLHEQSASSPDEVRRPSMRQHDQTFALDMCRDGLASSQASG
jgi:hypothetical protein